MALYLHVQAGAFRFLVAATAVGQVVGGRRVTEALPVGRRENMAAQREWQRRTRKVVDCRALFGLPPREEGVPPVELFLSSPAAVAAEGAEQDEAPSVPVLLVDAILGLEHFEARAFRPFPAGGGEARRYFDAVAARPGDGLALPRWKDGAAT